MSTSLECYNFQVPSSIKVPNITAYTQAPVAVSTAAGTSAPVSADLYPTGFGIFTLDGSGRGALLNVNPDGTVSVNSPSNSATPGSYLALFGTGLGPVQFTGGWKQRPPTPCCGSKRANRGSLQAASDFPGGTMLDAGTIAVAGPAGIQTVQASAPRGNPLISLLCRRVRSSKEHF